MSSNIMTLKSRLGSLQIVQKAPYDRSHKSYFWHATVSMVLSCIKQDIGRKS